MARADGSRRHGPATLALRLLLALSFAALAAAGASSKLPADFKRCTQAEVRASTDCLRAAVEDTLPKLKEGLPKLGLPPLDPLLIEKLTISQGGDGPVSMQLNFMNFLTAGLMEGTKVLKAELDLDNMVIDSKTLLPRAVVTSNYTVSGHVLVLPISGAGGCRIVLDEVASQWTMKGKRVTKKDGKDYMEVNEAVISMVPKKMHMQMDNLFNGDPQLGQAMNRVLNDNWELVYNEIGASLNEAYAEVIKTHARSLFRHVPLDNLFPESL